VAWDLDRDDWRIFRLDRLAPRSPAGPGFTPRPLPAADALTFVAARSKGSETADRWPCVGEFVVDLPLADVVSWIGDGEVEELAHGGCRITVGSWSWMGLLAFVARFDAPFRIVGPATLVEASRVLVERVRLAS
jgi:predicted DNA-binding transcriptional regulator YafY